MKTMILALSLLLSASALAQSQSRTVEGTIAWFTPQGEVEMQTGDRFPMARVGNGDSKSMTPYAVKVLNHMVDEDPEPLPLETLMSVGYADKVRLTIENDVVTMIDILYIEQ